MSKKYLYYFSEGNDAFGGDKVTMKNTLGGKGAGLGIGGVDGLIVGAAVRTFAEGPVGGFGVVVVILARGRFDVQGDDPDAFLAGEVSHFLGTHAHAGVAVGLLQGAGVGEQNDEAGVVVFPA